MRVHDVEIALAGTDGASVIVLPCIEDDEARRFFFGPLLASASAHRHPHNLYRKVRHMASRRLATDDEVAHVRDKRPDVWACVVRERCEQKARSNRSRMRARRERAHDSSPPRDADDGSEADAAAFIADGGAVGGLCLIEVTARLVEYMAAHVVRPLGDAASSRPPKRLWPEIEPSIAEWAAVRDAAFLSAVDAHDEPTRKRRRRRKQSRPLASLVRLA